MSDPYGSNPYGQPNPYGGGGGAGGGYGPPQGGGFGQTPPKTDGVSVASLVLSLLCCTSLIGLILGFVGLRRTKGGQRKGRGFAIAGIVLGLLGVIAGIVGGIFLFVFADSLVTPENAKVGQCIDVAEEDDNVILRKKDCTEEHDGEIVGIAKVTSDNLEEVESSMAGYCTEAIDSDDLAKLTDYLDDIDAVTEDPKNVEVGDHLVCYVNSGDKLSEPLL